MDKHSNQKINFSLPLIVGLLPIWPALSFISKNKYEPDFDITWLFILFFIITVFLYFIYYLLLGLKNENFSLKVLVTLSVLFCFFQFYFDFKAIVPEGLSKQHVLIIFSVTAIVICFFTYSIFNARNISVLNNFTLIVLLLPLFNILGDPGELRVDILNKDNQSPEQQHFPNSINEPNIYFFIFDGYLRSDHLNKYYGFDNNSFIEKLEYRGFKIAKRSRSNFSNTKRSLNFILNPSLSNLDWHSLASQLSTKSSFLGIDHSEVELNLRNRGYSFIMMNFTGEKNSACEPYCISVDKVFSYSQLQFIKTTPFFDLYTLLVSEKIQEFFTTPTDHRYALNNIPEQIENPIYLFSHILVPHPSFPMNPDCTFREDITDVSLDMDMTKAVSILRKQYLTKVECANMQMIEIADRLATQDKDSIILFVSDHGWTADLVTTLPPLSTEELNNLETSLKMSNFMALRAPQHCMKYFKDDITLAHSFPIIFSCLDNKIPAEAEQRSFIIVGSKQNKTLKDVTDKVISPY